MKKIVLIISSCMLSYAAFSQTYALTGISYISISKDTLFLPDNELGRLVNGLWINYVGKKPVILITSEEVIRLKHSKGCDHRPTQIKTNGRLSPIFDTISIKRNQI